MSWHICNAYELFDGYRTYWDSINRENGNHVLLDSLFWKSLVDWLGSREVCLVLNDTSKGKGVALIERGGYGFWRTFQPSQAPLGPIIFDRLAAIHLGEHICDLISDLPGYPLGFAVTQQDPDVTCFGNLNGTPAVEKLDYIQTPRLTISGKYEDYWKQRRKNLTHNLSRQRRRLREEGGVLELAMDRTAEAVADAVREYGLLETTGWKGEEGSAVAADNVQGRFYREMLQNFCSRGEAVIYRLRLNGKTVASDLCLQRDGTLVILKTAYDESVQGLSLGLLLHQEIFQSVFEEGKIRVIEFYGRLRDWHTKWTNEIRTMYHINFYRHRWVGTARRWLKNAAVKKGAS